MKQETLEEVAEQHRYGLPIHNFIRGAKWQMEISYSEEELKLPSKWKKWYKNNWNTSIEMEKQQSYSEEEVLKLILTSSKLPFANDEERIDWFEKFKKK